MNIKQFVDELFQTKNEDGKRWLREHIKAVGGSWEAYSTCAFTNESLTHLFYGISARVTKQISGMSDFRQLLFNARCFLSEVRQKGKEHGLEPDEPSLDAIIVPRRHI